MCVGAGGGFVCVGDVFGLAVAVVVSDGEAGGEYVLDDELES